MAYSSTAAWDRLYGGQGAMAYPAEGVIRIFKGRFPGLTMPSRTEGLSILDLGCGDGRHLPFLHGLGFQVHGVEITEAICAMLRARMADFGVPADLRVGHAASLPFEDARFDRLLTWNSCYYMSMARLAFEDHVAEMARVLRPGGWIVASVPKRSSFIFNGSEPAEVRGYRVIRDDYFGARNGEVMRCMEDRDDLVASFAPEFDSFCHADIDMDWFGLAYHWHVFCARRKG